MLRHRVFLPTAGVTEPRHAFDWANHSLRVQMEAEPFPDGQPPVVVGVSSFGIGGSFGHAVLEEYRPPPSPPKPIFIKHEALGYHLLPLSAHSLAHLRLYADHMSEHLRGHPNASSLTLRDMCGTMARHRSRFATRKCFVAASSASMVSQLEAFGATGEVSQPGTRGAKTRVAFVFTGQGSQWQGMGKDLMAFPVYRNAVQKVDALFQHEAQWSILEKLSELTTDEMMPAHYAQPMTFLVQIGLVELLKYFHVVPDVVLGHSAGEVAAFYAAGLLSLEDSVKTIYHRSVEQRKLEGSGRMLAVGMSKSTVMSYIEDMEDVEIACINSPESIVLTSSEARLHEVVARLPENIRKAWIPGSVAFHSSKTDPILNSLRKRLEFLDGLPRTWSIPCISTVTGKSLSHVDAAYCCSNVREPVRFQTAIEQIFSDEEQAPEIVVEIGPHRTLVSPILQTLSSLQQQAMVVPSLKRGGPCCKNILEMLGLLFEKGIPVGFEVLAEDQGFEFYEDLPKHPFIRKPLTTTPEYLRRDLFASVRSLGPTVGAVRLAFGMQS